MGGVTNYWGFQYPTGTDRVADGDNAIQTLAQQVDSTLTTQLTGGKIPYTAVTWPANGWTGSVYYGVRAGWVHVWVSVGKVQWDVAPDLIFTLPAGVRPGLGIWINALGINDVNQVVPTVLAPDGTCNVRRPSTGTSTGGIIGDFVYPLGLVGGLLLRDALDDRDKVDNLLPDGEPEPDNELPETPEA